jgi:hypothetical protein
MQAVEIFFGVTENNGAIFIMDFPIFVIHSFQNGEVELSV